MRSLLVTLLFAVSTLFSAGCVSMATPAANTADLADVDLSRNYKTGKSCATYFFVFGPFGDASVIDAAKNGKISKAKVVDYETRNYLIVQQFCTVVHGE